MSHRTTAITTTPFKMALICPCMGMKRLTSHSNRPTTHSAITTVTSGILFSNHLHGPDLHIELLEQVDNVVLICLLFARLISVIACANHRNRAGLRNNDGYCAFALPGRL